MGNNKKKSKVKKGNVKEFPVKKDNKKVDDKKVDKKAKNTEPAELTPLDKQKKELNKKRVLYIVYTVFCFIVVLAIAGFVGYYATNAVAAQSQKMFAHHNSTTGFDMALSQNAMYGNWWYGLIIYPVAFFLVLAITGKDRLYHLVGFGLGYGGAMFLTYFLSVRTLKGLGAYFETFRLIFCTAGAVGIALPFVLGIAVLVIKILRYNHLVKKGVIKEDDDYIQYDPLETVEVSKF